MEKDVQLDVERLSGEKSIVLSEHEAFSEETLKIIHNYVKTFKSDAPSEHLGIYSERANYYVGTSWLSEKDNVLLTVLPKIENRLLKRALVISKHLLESLHIHKNRDYHPVIDKLDSEIVAFHSVGDNFAMSEIRSMKQNKLYRNYTESIKIAKEIILLSDNSIQRTGEKEFLVHEFYIDMPRLYEMYVYSLLKRAYSSSISFQVEGSYHSRADFTRKSKREKIIIDAKYKLGYEKENEKILNDIGELSRYGRDVKIRKELGVSENEIVPCVIIYPERNESGNESDERFGECSEKSVFDKEKTIIEQCEEIKEFSNFYKVKVPLPLL